MLKKLNLIILGLTALLAISCGKDDPVPDNKQIPVPNTRSCLLLEDKYTKYSYNSQGQLTKVDYSDKNIEFELLEYDGEGKLIRKNSYGEDLDSIPFVYENYIYNSAGKLIRANWYFSKILGGPFELDSYQIFVYDSNGKLSERNLFRSTQSGLPYMYFRYTYFLNGDIEQKWFSDPNETGTPLGGITWLVSYDKKKNIHSSLPEAFVLADLGGFPFNFEHNIMSYKELRGQTFEQQETFIYEYNNDGYPTKVKMQLAGGQVDNNRNFYNYSCQ